MFFMKCMSIIRLLNSVRTSYGGITIIEAPRMAIKETRKVRVTRSGISLLRRLLKHMYKKIVGVK